MTEDQWGVAWRVYQAAMDLPPGERRAFVDSTGDPEIVQAVLAMMDEEECTPESQVATSWIGKRIGRYQVTAELGRGGMGEVYSAEDTELDRTVALKFLNARAIGHPSAVERFIREAKAASALNHPNIVTVHEVIRAESNLAIAMELVEGAPLRALCGAPLELDRVIYISQQIAQALAIAHEAGLVHRDIKPENVMVRPDGYIKVLDFGLARRFADDDTGQTLTGVHTATDGLNFTSSFGFGTFRYMSPEQYRGESLTGASDVFSLGIIVYELATGKHPFGRETPVETFDAIAGTIPESPSAVNPQIRPELGQLILSMLNKEPRSRPTAEAVSRKLTEFGQKSGAQKVVMRTNLRWFAAVAGLLIVAGIIGWRFLNREKSLELGDLTIRPLTSQTGWESYPSLSPDGKSVAYCWTERTDRPKQIYIKRLDAGDRDPVKLAGSKTEGEINALAWSPDGKRIAFVRWEAPVGAIYSVSLTGDERQLAELSNRNTSTIDWSPDGAELAFSNEGSIHLLDVKTGKKRAVTSPKGVIGDWDPRFSPDGRTIAFKRVSGTFVDDIYLVPAAGGDPERLTTDRRGIWGHAWARDGRSLIVSSQRGGGLHGIWQIPLDRQVQPRRITEGGLDSITPAMARNANRLVWVSQQEDYNIYRVPAAGGGMPSRLVASTMRDRGPVYSPNGRIAFISDRSGAKEVWIARADGSNPYRVTNFNGPSCGSERWSPDGRQVAFESLQFGNPDVFVADCEQESMRCGEPRRVTTDTTSELVPSWSRDGRFLYFASNRSGRWEAWRMPAAGGPALQITTNGGMAPVESHDARWLYYTKGSSPGIWRMPLPELGREELVLNKIFPVAQEWDFGREEIVFIDRPGRGEPGILRAFHLSSRRLRQILSFADLGVEPRPTGVSLSPDATWIAYSQLDRSGSNVIVGEIGR